MQIYKLITVCIFILLGGVKTKEILNEKPCLLPNNETGECVSYYLCDNGTLNTDGSYILDIRHDINECDDMFEQCCSLGDIKQTSSLENTTPESAKNTGVTEEPQRCGIRNENGLAFKITGATNGEAEFAEFPWMVAVLGKKQTDEAILDVYLCGGSLINRNIVLTAAHCVNGKPANMLKIRAGEWDTQTIKEPYPFSDHEVNDVVVNSEFNPKSLKNDIALLFLTEPVKNQPHIGTVCLPPEGAVFDGSRCFASGWGKSEFGKEGKYQVILKKVELPVVPYTQCQDSLKQTRLGKYFKLDESFICAGGEKGKDTCKGDGGSPLVCPAQDKPGSYYQAGIVAWGIGCGEQGIPGAYANVALFRDWIDQQVQSKGYDSSSYTAV